MAGNEANQVSRPQFRLERLQSRRLLSAVLDLDAPVEEVVDETAPAEVVEYSDTGNPDELIYMTFDIVDPPCDTFIPAEPFVIECFGEPVAEDYIYETEILTMEETGEENYEILTFGGEELVDPELGDPMPEYIYECEILVIDENGEILEATGGIAPNQRGDGVEIVDDVVTTLSNEIFETGGPVASPVIEELAQAAPPAAAAQFTGSSGASDDLLNSEDDDLLNTADAAVI